MPAARFDLRTHSPSRLWQLRPQRWNRQEAWAGNAKERLEDWPFCGCEPSRTPEPAINYPVDPAEFQSLWTSRRAWLEGMTWLGPPDPHPEARDAAQVRVSLEILRPARLSPENHFAAGTVSWLRGFQHPNGLSAAREVRPRGS